MFYMAQARSVEEQIALLRATIPFAHHMHKWLLAGAAAGAVAALALWHPVPLMIAVFLGVVGLAEHRAGPNIVSALAAYDRGTATEGSVTVAITSWDMNDTYLATVREASHADWTYEFVPQGWQPASRGYPAKIWRTHSGGPPVLAVVGEGVLIPRYDPKPVPGRGT